MKKLGEGSAALTALWVASCIEVKHIVRQFHTVKPDSKYLIIVGVNGSDVGAVFINSNINQQIHYSSELRMLHHPIKKADYPEFLTKDLSYIDCTDIFEIERLRIEENLLAKTANHIGMLKEHDFTSVVDLLCLSPVATPRLLKKYGLK
jgi:hypothetical protein